MTDDSFRIPGPRLITAEAAHTIHLALGMMVELASGGAPDLAKRIIIILHCCSHGILVGRRSLSFLFSLPYILA
jgi:hypothetical protein